MMSYAKQKIAAFFSQQGRLCSRLAWSAFGRSTGTYAVDFISQKAKLYGEVFVPQGKKTFPGVILCHGLGSDLRAVRSCARALTRRGIAALAFDFQGHGRSSGICNGNLVEDVKAAVGVLAKCSQVDLKNIALVGHSLGARTVLLASRELDGLRALVSLSCPPDDISSWASSSASNLYHNLARKGSHIFEYPRDGSLPWLGFFEGAISRLWMRIRGYRLYIDWQKCFEFLSKARTLVAVKEMKQHPTLFVHCRGDKKSPYQASIELYREAGGPKDLIIPRGGFHSTPLLPGGVRSMWLDWLESMLKYGESGRRI